MLDNLKSQVALVGEAYFATYLLLCEQRKRRVDAVFEKNAQRLQVTDFCRGPRLGARDHLLTWEKPKTRPAWMTPAAYEAAPETLCMRELRAGGKTQMTTLLDAKAVTKPSAAAHHASAAKQPAALKDRMYGCNRLRVTIADRLF